MGLFATRGFAATGIRDIAEAAGLSSASLYEYMTSKDDLLVEVMHDSIEPLVVAGTRIRRAVSGADAQLAALTECHVWFHIQYPHETLVTDTEVRALSGARRTEIVALRDRYERVWQSIVDAGARARIFDVVERRVAVRSIVMMSTGVAAWYRPGGSMSVERLCAAYADLALATVRASRAGRAVRRADLALDDPISFVSEGRTA
ncbi:MAG TPA: TetR/AcrR family transcriptional regulator [Ilumatobacteraceae bacterium]